MIQTICRITILVASGLLILAPVSPIELSTVTGIAGIIILLSSMPALGGAYKKPVYVFLALSVFLFIHYRLTFTDLINGSNSMLAIAAIVAVLQIFAIPVKIGNYDRVLEKYLQIKYKKEVSLFVFLKLITHVLGSFMLFGSVPILFTIFYEPLCNMVHDPKRFIATALGRSFALVTLWAPGTVNVILVLEVTGAKWLHVLLPAVMLALLGLVTSVLLEAKLHLKDRQVQSRAIAVTQEDSIIEQASTIEQDNITEQDKKKFITLILIAVILIISIVVMENLHFLTSTTRVIAAGLFIGSVWILRYARKPQLSAALRSYWEKSLYVARDLAALFIAMGIFAEAVYRAGLISYLQSGMTSGAAMLGQYTFLLIPPILILLSLIGIHPFISILLIGKMLVATIQMPHYEIYIALSLLLGGVISFVLSPFAGNVLSISRMADCSPKEVAYKWNGLFSLVFLLEGFILLLVMQMILK